MTVCHFTLTARLSNATLTVEGELSADEFFDLVSQLAGTAGPPPAQQKPKPAKAKRKQPPVSDDILDFEHEEPWLACVDCGHKFTSTRGLNIHRGQQHKPAPALMELA